MEGQGMEKGEKKGIWGTREKGQNGGEKTGEGEVKKGKGERKNKEM